MRLDDQLLQDRLMEPSDPVDCDSLHAANVMTAATADASKSHTRQPGLERMTKKKPR